MSSTLPYPTLIPLSDHRKPHVRRALELMLDAHRCAEQIGCAAWEFAVELSQFQRADVTLTDLRWLRRQGYVDVGREVTTESDSQRRFKQLCNLHFTEDCCFVLTETGLLLALRSVTDNSVQDSLLIPPQSSAKPIWDRDRQWLTFGGVLVKHFRQPAGNQTLILETFEEEGWPVRIDDPLPQTSGTCPKRKLHDTILGLNRNQRQRLLQFHGDGSGEGVRWEELHQGTTSATTAVL